MEWFKKHADTVMILGSFALCFWHMNEKMNDGFNRFDNRLSNMRIDIDNHFSQIEKEVAIIKTVLVIKNILPQELATHKEEKIRED